MTASGRLIVIDRVLESLDRRINAELSFQCIRPDDFGRREINCPIVPNSRWAHQPSQKT